MYSNEMYHAALNILSTREEQLNDHDEDELYHHGILGQKWGIRRYQNEDGTLTPAGKKRYYLNGIDESSGLTKAGQKWKKDQSMTDEERAAKKSKAIKTAVVIGATAAVATLAIIGAKTAIDYNKTGKNVKAYWDLLNKDRDVLDSYVGMAQQARQQDTDWEKKAVKNYKKVIHDKQISDDLVHPEKIKSRLNSDESAKRANMNAVKPNLDDLIKDLKRRPDNVADSKQANDYRKAVEELKKRQNKKDV